MDELDNLINEARSAQSEEEQLLFISRVQTFERKFTQFFSAKLLDVLKRAGGYRQSDWRASVNLYVDDIRIAYVDDAGITEWYVGDDSININNTTAMNDRALLLSIAKLRGSYIDE